MFVVGETRERMVQAAVRALQRQGVAGMSFTEVLRNSGAARGAIYHHFPGGKDELVAEAARRNGEDVRGFLAALPATTPDGVVAAFLEAVRPVVAASAEGGGCAVAAATVDAGSGVLRNTAAAAFATWTDALAERLETAGSADGRGLATMLIALLEGAHILCRASGTLEPFDAAANTMLSLVRA